MRVINSLPEQISLASDHPLRLDLMLYGDQAMRNQDAGISPEERDHREIKEISKRVVQDLEEILKAMNKAADQISSGRGAEEIDDSGFQLFLARKDSQDKSSRIEAILYALNHEDFYRRLEAAAGEAGLCLEEETRLEVELPEAEFEENMITGGFERYKGLAVEHYNRCLEDLMVAVCYRLRERGFAVACVPDEDVIFYLPIGSG